MCGIFAAMTRHGLSSERRDAALKLLEHRGPDGSGTSTSRDGQWTLGHTRLSIIGLDNGTQPMTSPDGSCSTSIRPLQCDAQRRQTLPKTDSGTPAAVALNDLLGGAKYFEYRFPCVVVRYQMISK